MAKLKCRRCMFKTDLVSEATEHVLEREGHIVHGKGDAEETTITIETEKTRG